MDTKKKETLGNFYREGVTDTIEPTIVNDHDFPSQGNGKVISVVKIIDKVFEKGRQYAADFKEKMSIQFDKLLPKWNYTAVPNGK